MTREQDARVAELMGCESRRPSGLGNTWLWKPHGYATDLPRFTTDASADYLVLKWVLESWSKDRLLRFSEGLYDLWDARAAESDPRGDDRWIDAMLYTPGDYSRAALAVVERACD